MIWRSLTLCCFQAAIVFSDRKFVPASQYTIKRLVRGLGSSREGARQGYAVALTEVCHALHVVSLCFDCAH